MRLKIFLGVLISGTDRVYLLTRGTREKQLSGGMIPGQLIR